uniref:Ig-like domain-containing protein n=2 Tax=Meloidogyne TaxID=189290 RepID=A0A6V7TS27_MELEN|nr:unnamed protein product [Meloidogyne enterolobii]CAD2171438.1 unnamed protein product [Meloidogyne enterolobii]
MSPPAIQGQPKIRHDEQTNSVFLEVSVLGAEATKTKWYLEEKEIASGTGAYRMSTQEQEGGKKLIICEIKNYDKSMQGTYKAVFFSPDGKENYATFTVKSGNAPEFYEKPKITQKDGGKVIQIKIRVKSHIEMKAEWFKDESPLKTDNRIKLSTEKDSSEPDGTILLLEINDPTKEDQAKYKCVVKNGEGRNEQSLNLVFD